MALYMDQLSVHTSKATARVLKEQRFEWVFNPAYSPFANPVEECFSVAKQSFKKARLNKIMNNSNETNEVMIEKAFEKVTAELVKGCVRHSKFLVH